MLLLGIDVGTSSIKVAVVDASSGKTIATAQHPETEVPIIAPQPGWAEQDPDTWWLHTRQAILNANSSGAYNPQDIAAIGIAYQMHGLVVLDEKMDVLRPSIIWCDSRAVPLGEKAFDAIGHEHCLQNLLNSPGNFTASKLAWVKANQPEVFKQVRWAMLPGDFIGLRLTGELTTTASALSEGVLWNFTANQLAEEVVNHFGFDQRIFPVVNDVFSSHGQLQKAVAEELGLQPGIPVSYKAGDQPNNALSLQVLHPGEVAANAGTSGVIYGMSDKATFDPQSRVNSFAHVNHTQEQTRVGVLLCINGTGILNSFIKQKFAGQLSYAQMNEAAASVPVGSEGLTILPFGNGAERMLNSQTVGAHFMGFDFNRHQPAHVFRAAQEGIAAAFRYGLDIMRANGMQPNVIRAGRSNMFLSDVFTEAFVNTTGVAVELYEADGSVGAAFGAGIGAGIFKEPKDAFANFSPLKTIVPSQTNAYNELYAVWLKRLNQVL